MLIKNLSHRLVVQAVRNLTGAQVNTAVVSRSLVCSDRARFLPLLPRGASPPPMSGRRVGVGDQPLPSCRRDQDFFGKVCITGIGDELPHALYEVDQF